MKETWDPTMPERIETCARAEELVAYLYDEATPAEKLSFERHAHQCATCRTELASFTDVRVAIGEWRGQSLGTMAAPALTTSAAFVADKGSVRQRRSALAALREFFTLSPLWMRAATAVAAVIFCALAVIAVAYFRNQPNVIVLEKQNQPDKVVQEKAEQAATRSSMSGQEQQSPTVTRQPLVKREVVASAGGDHTQLPKQLKRRAVPSSTQSIASQRKVAPRGINRQTEEEVADYLPFTASNKEAKLPSLADLADDSN